MEHPHGFAEHPSGLLVPEAVARKRQVWTKAELKTVSKAIELLNASRVDFQSRCNLKDCPDKRITIAHEPDGVHWRCGCTDRVFTTAF